MTDDGASEFSAFLQNATSRTANRREEDKEREKEQRESPSAHARRLQKGRKMKRWCCQHLGGAGGTLEAVTLLICLLGVGGRKTSLTVRDDARPGFLVEPFCFTGGGLLQFDVRDFHLTTAGGAPAQPTKVGVIVRRVDGAATPFATTSAADRAGSVCLISHKKPGDQVVFIKGTNASFSQTVADPAAGLYSLIYANCDPGTAASFSLTATLTNPGGVFLSAGDIPLPLIYGSASILFVLAFAVWQRTLMANAASAHKIHYLMSALCLVRAASVGFEAMRYQSMKMTGDGYTWATLYYLLTFIKGVMLFSVILLIGTGWSFVKPFLQDRDKKILLAVVPLQVAHLIYLCNDSFI